MRSIKEIFVVGHGPSSSHTMGPAFACEYILNKYPNPKKIDVTLYQSLALTGKGHLTDWIIDLKLKNVAHSIIFDCKTATKHPNTMVFEVTTNEGKVVKETIISIGGGTILTGDGIETSSKDVYPEKNMREIMAYCKENNVSLADYVLQKEDKDIISYLSNVYDVMMAARERGINTEGELPGSLHIKRKAHIMYQNMINEKQIKNIDMNVAITSFAVAEENAAGGVISIAPTCGSAGVLPGCITYLQLQGHTKDEIVKGMLVAGLVGIIAKTNASVSGAECGCQAEIGVACAMSAAMVAAVEGYDNEDTAQAAEIAMEHSLGLTCDPVDGYVQIPCIERCAIFALKAINAASLALLIPYSGTKVNYDDALKTMYQTGKDLKKGYRETSTSGLAKLIK